MDSPEDYYKYRVLFSTYWSVSICQILKLRVNASCVNIAVSMIHVGYWTEGACDGCSV